jgi:hypothetical protein
MTASIRAARTKRIAIAAHPDKRRPCANCDRPVNIHRGGAVLAGKQLEVRAASMAHSLNPKQRLKTFEAALRTSRRTS